MHKGHFSMGFFHMKKKVLFVFFIFYIGNIYSCYTVAHPGPLMPGVLGRRTLVVNILIHTLLVQNRTVALKKQKAQ